MCARGRRRGHAQQLVNYQTRSSFFGDGSSAARRRYPLQQARFPQLLIAWLRRNCGALTLSWLAQRVRFSLVMTLAQRLRACALATCATEMIPLIRQPLARVIRALSVWTGELLCRSGLCAFPFATGSSSSELRCHSAASTHPPPFKVLLRA